MVSIMSFEPTNLTCAGISHAAQISAPLTRILTLGDSDVYMRIPFQRSWSSLTRGERNVFIGFTLKRWY